MALLILGCAACICCWEASSFIQGPPGSSPAVTAALRHGGERQAPRGLIEEDNGIGAPLTKQQQPVQRSGAWDSTAVAQALLLGTALGFCASPGEAVAKPFVASSSFAIPTEGAGASALGFAGFASLVTRCSQENPAVGKGFLFFTVLLVATVTLVVGGALPDKVVERAGASRGTGAFAAAVFVAVSAQKLAVQLSTPEKVGRSLRGAALAALILGSVPLAVPGLTAKLSALPVAQQSALSANVLALEAAVFLLFGAQMLWTTQAGKALGLTGSVILAVMLNPVPAAGSTSLAAGALTFAGVCFAQTCSNNKRKLWEKNGITLPKPQRQHLVASFMDFLAGKSAMTEFVPDRTTMAFWLSGFVLTGILADPVRGKYETDTLSAGVLTFAGICFLALSSNNKTKEWEAKGLVVPMQTQTVQIPEEQGEEIPDQQDEEILDQQDEEAVEK